MRKHGFFFVGIVLSVVILGIAGIFTYLLFSSSSEKRIQILEKQPTQPEELAAHYFSLVSAGQYEELFSMLSTDSQAAVDKDTFAARYKNIYGGIEMSDLTTTIDGVVDYEVLIGNKGEDDGLKAVKKRVQYSQHMNTAAGEVAFTNYMIVSMNEGEYRVEWTPQLIFPALSGNDKVKVNKPKGERGSIYDRNHNLLAGSGIASSVGFVPGKMNRDEQTNGYMEEDIAKAAEFLEQTPESLTGKLNASYVKDDTFVFLKNVPKEAYDLKEELLTIPGVKITDTTVRYYPLGQKASHLVGYIQGINAEELELLQGQGYNANSVIGKTGLESIYEDDLRGSDGCEIIITDENGNTKEILARIDKQDGKDIILTIDAQLQSQLYDIFQEDKSCSVAINPKTGEVLALVSTPTYDANDFVLGMSNRKWTELSEDEAQPLYNRFKAALCPGSVFKAVTAAIGVDSGKISPAEDFGHSGLTWRKGEGWGGYYITTTKEYSEPANIENALVYSDNIYFAKAALAIGGDLFARELLALGFEDRIPFEYGLYSSTISGTETFTSEIQLADSGFGQGQILVNPLHLACIYSAFVNDGSMIQPYLIRSEKAAPEYWKAHIFTSETAGIIRDSLVQVVERGTATDAKVQGRLLGGKTGTAEIKQAKDDQTGTELGWFVQFTADPGEQNPLLVISMVEDVKGRGGSHYVSTKVKTIFE